MGGWRYGLVRNGKSTGRRATVTTLRNLIVRLMKSSNTRIASATPPILQHLTGTGELNRTSSYFIICRSPCEHRGNRRCEGDGHNQPWVASNIAGNDSANYKGPL